LSPFKSQVRDEVPSDEDLWLWHMLVAQAY